MINSFLCSVLDGVCVLIKTHLFQTASLASMLYGLLPCRVNPLQVLKSELGPSCPSIFQGILAVLKQKETKQLMKHPSLSHFLVWSCLSKMIPKYIFENYYRVAINKRN